MTTRRLLVLVGWVLGVMMIASVVIALWAFSCPETAAEGSTRAACVQTRSLAALLTAGLIGGVGAAAIVRHGRPKREREPWEW